MANTFRKNPVWDTMVQKDIKCSVKSRTKMEPDWLYAFDDAYCSIVKKGNKYGIVARTYKDVDYTGVCACKYDSLYLLYMLDEYKGCNYAYFAVMKNGKYGVFRVESSYEFCEQLYGREVVPCMYDQIAPINTTHSLFNVILLMNNRKEVYEYNTEIDYIEMSYYNGFTNNISDVYRGILALGDYLECYKLYERGYLVNVFNDSLVHKSNNHSCYRRMGKTKRWEVFMENCLAAANKEILIFYDVQDRGTFIIESVEKIRSFCGEDAIERIVAYKDNERIEIKIEDKGLFKKSH